jgi:hypothetical protein
VKKRLQDYLEGKLLDFCKICISDKKYRIGSPLGRARREAKTIAKYIKKRWEIKE